MTVSSIISFIGISYFAYRVHLYKGDSSGPLRYLKLFTYTFFLFLLFHFVQIVFFEALPVTLLKSLYLLDKSFSLVASVFAAVMAVNYVKPRAVKGTMYSLFTIAGLIVVYLLFNFPTPRYLHPFVSWSRTQPIFLIDLFMTAGFFAAIFSFFVLAYKYQEQRLRFVSFGLAFLLWIIGGPMHAAKSQSVVIMADMIVLTGFALMGYILFAKKPKS
jgi:hypothetical protein